MRFQEHAGKGSMLPIIDGTRESSGEECGNCLADGIKGPRQDACARIADEHQSERRKAMLSGLQQQD